MSTATLDKPKAKKKAAAATPATPPAGALVWKTGSHADQRAVADNTARIVDPDSERVAQFVVERARDGERVEWVIDLTSAELLRSVDSLPVFASMDAAKAWCEARNAELSKPAGAAPAASAEAFTPKFRMIPLERITESPTNPRKHFAGVEELAESIRVKGVVQPVVVRPVTVWRIAEQDPAFPGLWHVGCFNFIGKFNKHHTCHSREEAERKRDELQAVERFELVAGARRTRAAKLAGLTEIPAIVRDLSDKDVLEIQVIENDQREDVNPLDQANGYKALIESAGYDVAALAAKTGRGESYVRQRLQLTKLHAKWQEKMWAGEIHIGHAILLARMTPENQEDLFKEHFRYRKEAPTVAELSREIRENYVLDLHGATFPKEDADLVPKAGSCVQCPKRTGFDKSLFPDIKQKDTCTDRNCYHAKQAAFVQLQIHKAAEQADGGDVVKVTTSYYHDSDKSVLTKGGYEIVSPKEAKKLPAKDVKTAVVVDGEQVGRIVTIKVANKNASAASGGNDDYKKRQKAEQEKVRRHTAAKDAVVDAVLKKVDRPATHADLAGIAEAFFNRLDSDTQRRVAKRRGWEKPAKTSEHGFGWIEDAAREEISGLDPVELHKFLVEIDLCRFAFTYTCDSEPGRLDDHFKTTAEYYGVDAKRVQGEALKAAAAAAKNQPTSNKGKANAKQGKKASSK